MESLAKLGFNRRNDPWGVAVYSLAAKLIAIAYRVFAMLPLQNKVAFFSRQGKEKSLDFAMLEEALMAAMPNVKVAVCVSEPESKSKCAFFASLPRMIYHVATARVCVLEGYIPAVSVPDLRKGTKVVQLWHAMGAIKKFGLQSVGTRAGRSKDAAQKMKMHVNYDYIIAAGEGAKPAYAEAFGYGENTVRSLGMPRMDYLLDESARSSRSYAMRKLGEKYDFLNAHQLKILYAPTMRQGSAGWMASETQKLAEAFSHKDCVLIVAGHPLDAATAADRQIKDAHYASDAKSIDLLGFVDCVITDYSAVAFEAFVAEKPVWFYVPDIEDYRKTPGLNIDPEIDFPDVAFRDAASLAECIVASASESRYQSPDQFNAFCSRYFGNVSVGSTQRLAEFVRACYIESFEING